MISTRTSKCVTCDSCGYIISGLYGDLSNADKIDFVLLRTSGEEFHFHADGADYEEQRCFLRFQEEEGYRQRALEERLYARLMDEATKRARAEVKDTLDAIRAEAEAERA